MNTPNPTLTSLAHGSVKLAGAIFQDRFNVNRRYVLDLKNDALLQNFYHEAALPVRGNWGGHGEDEHGGWESPICQLRGHFLGHWLSAAAKIAALTGDVETRVKAERVVDELRRCQETNGGEWAGSIPEKYLHWIAGELPKRNIWAPHYTLHKTLMGLMDMVTYLGSETALDVLVRFARWFHRWSGTFSRDAFDDILDVETGAMMEVWASLYGVTGDAAHRELMDRYERRRLFDALLRGEDALTNMHANTTIPEAHGAARAYEVTGEPRYRAITEAYWDFAVVRRGTYCTGGQTSGEIWTPPFEFAARRGDKNQEHCTVYNMIRLADYLLRWTGDAVYADYIERNLYNGILAQQNPSTGMISYFLPLQAGAKKKWGSPTKDFWCCHGTLVQAHASYAEWAWYADTDGPVLSQFIPSAVTWTTPNGAPVRLTLAQTSRPGSSEDNASPAGESHRPNAWIYDLRLECDTPSEFVLKIRIPEWIAGPATIRIDGEAHPADAKAGSFLAIRRTWANNDIKLIFPKALRTLPIPDEPQTVAFVDGPVVLAGLCNEERTLVGDPSSPETLLTIDNEREWGNWLPGYRAVGQDRGLRFVPLHAIVDEPFTVYFPVRKTG